MSSKARRGPSRSERFLTELGRKREKASAQGASAGGASAEVTPAQKTPVVRVSLAEKAFRSLELPVETAAGLPHLELSGNREAVVDGCRGILEYDENIVRVRAGSLTLRFTGTALQLKNLRPDSVVIVGFLSGIEFQF
jgi:sporulation protein YqfC